MASEIRVNSITNRSGLGTVTFSDTGVVLSGVSTFSTGIVVAAGSASSPSISPSGDSNTGIFFPAADTIAFAEGGVEVGRFNSSGYLGIGTNNPIYPLHVRGITSARFDKADTTQISQVRLRTNQDSYATEWALGQSANALNFSLAYNNTSSWNEYFNIDSNGRVTMPFQPFVFVVRSASVSMASGAKIPFDSVVDSRGLTWNTSNNNFVVPATGVYTFSIYIRLATTSVNYIFAQIRSNGTPLYNGSYIYLQKPNTLDSFQTAGVTISVKLTQNDTVDVTGTWNGSTSHILEANQSLMSIVFNG
jgi:hypothetical protein